MPPRFQAEAGQNIEVIAEKLHEQDRDDEAGHRYADGCKGQRKRIEYGALPDGGDDAQRQTDDDRNADRDQAHAGGHREFAAHQLVDGGADLLIRFAQIAVQQIIQIQNELFAHGFVQAVFLLEHIQRFLRQLLVVARIERAAGNGMHQEKGYGNQDQNGEQTGHNAFDNVADHVDFLLLGIALEPSGGVRIQKIIPSTFAIATIIHDESVICKFISRRMH